MQRLKLIGFLVGLFLFIWLLSHCDLSGVWQQILRFQFRFAWILLFYPVIFGLDTLGWQCALRSHVKNRIRLDRLFRVRLVGEALNYVTPTASMGGEPVKALILSRRYDVPLSDGMASVVVAKTTFTVSMLLFVMTGIIVTYATQSALPLALRGILWSAFGVLLVLLSLFVVVQFQKPFGKAAGWLRRINPALEAKVSQWDERVVQIYRKSPRLILLSLAFHFLGWMAGIVEVYLILRFLQIPVSLATAWSIEALWVLLRSASFLIPGALGASEGISLLVCAAVGISAVSGLALALIRRARELVWVGLGLVEFSRS